ncbi:TPA: methionyl-tRNA formyltransferase [Candidatus Uhrbacteria bacterium]|nr:methionyl-tRNA formyltransferase [Candidatus Uhrbacteria bacterium]
MINIVFFGTPEFAVPFLKELILDSEVNVACIVTQPDKPSGRGAQMTPPPVKMAAEEKNIPVLQPSSLKTNPEIEKELRAFNADLFIVVAYGKIIPKNILEIPTKGCLNVHPSLLPQYRGPSPLQWAIVQGVPQTGVTIMLLDEGTDTGPVLASEIITLDAEETYDSLVQKVHAIGPRLLLSTLKRFIKNEIILLIQDESKATMTRLLDKEDGHVLWTAAMDEIERKHRAYNPWPGTWSVWERTQGKTVRIKFLHIQPTDYKADLAPGTVSLKEGHLFVDCVDGTIEILELQIEGKPKMEASSFIQGYKDIEGTVLN